MHVCMHTYLDIHIITSSSTYMPGQLATSKQVSKKKTSTQERKHFTEAKNPLPFLADVPKSGNFFDGKPQWCPACK